MRFEDSTPTVLPAAATGNFVSALIQFPESAAQVEMRVLLDEFAAQALAAVEQIRSERALLECAAASAAARRLSYSESEAAAELGISEITLARIRRNGKISYSRSARAIRYLPAHLEKFLEANQVLCARDNARRKQTVAQKNHEGE